MFFVLLFTAKPFQEDVGGTSVTVEMSEILGWVCFDLELWKRELSAAQCQIDGKDEERNLSQITSLQKCLWMCCQPAETSHRET